MNAMTVPALAHGLALLGHGLIWGWLAQAVAGPWVKSPGSRLLLLSSMALLAIVTGLAGLSRGLLSDLSLTLLLLLVTAALGIWLPAFRLPRSPRWLAGLVGAVGFGLYASVLGYLPFDLYVLGYQPRALLLGVVCMLMLLWFHEWKLAGLGGAGLMLAAWPGVHESQNLWDRLLDPVLWTLMLVVALRRKKGDVPP